MRFLLLPAVAITGLAVAGCQEESRAPRHVRAPRPGEGVVREYDDQRPLPHQPDQNAEGDTMPAPPFEDAPLVIQATPEQRAYVQAYEDVGRPTIAVFVNRSIDAEPLGKNKSGYSNELGMRAIDCEAMENVLMDWLAADGQVEIISPTGVRERLGETGTRELETGKLNSEKAGRTLHTDVLVEIRAQITKQTPEGPQMRLVAESINVNGGHSIARAVEDIPPPLTKQHINHYTRLVARKLMDGMIGNWRRVAKERRPGSENPLGKVAPDESRETKPLPPPEDPRDDEPLPPPGK